MLPASDLAEIISSLANLRLEPTTAAAVLSCVLTPLLRPDPEIGSVPGLRPIRKSRVTRPRSRERAWGSRRKRKYKRHAPSAARDQALAALTANPNASTTDIAKIAKCSRSTVVNAREDLAAEVRRKARRAARETSSTAKPPPSDRRQRAQHFLRDQLARGAKQASVVEDAAAKAHIDEQALGQARADLGIVTSRANTGGPQAVQWSLPG